MPEPVRLHELSERKQDKYADEVRALDAQIIHHDEQAHALRLRRRDIRIALHRAGWSWRALARLSNQNHFAVRKDAALNDY